jgi:RNA polymerase sigma factor (sigma-70 family)
VEELKSLVTRVQRGDDQAYNIIVQRFQDLAVGYSYAVLGDITLAEDIAQEAFIKAFYHLPDLHNPAAFPGWFRRIILTQLYRFKRRNKISAISLDSAPELCSDDQDNTLDPAEIIENREVQAEVSAAIATLSEAQREVLILFYISAYSQKEISEFLDLPLSTIKMRLYHARKQLKERIIKMIEDNLSEQRPSKDNAFTEKVLSLNERIVEMDKLLRGLPGQNINLEISLASTSWQIKAEPNQLQQTIANLVVNACEAMPQGGQITLETANMSLNDQNIAPNFGEQPGNYICLTVKDTGRGISDGVMPYIFDPSSPMIEKNKEMTLRLAEIFNFVEQHQGYIWVSSQEGNGATFQIYLPAFGVEG